MATEVVNLYISHISSFFDLTESSLDLSKDSTRGQEETLRLPLFVPAGTTVLTACHFGEKLVEEVNEGIADLVGVNIGGESGTSLRDMLQSLRTRLLLVVSTAWARGESLHSNCNVS